VVGHHAAGDPEEPEPIFGRGWNHLDTAPGHQEHLGRHIFDISSTDSPADIGVDGLTVGGKERFEPRGAFLGISGFDHAVNVHSSSLIRITWPGQARIRRRLAAF
jgi:hypothetical protein